MVGFRGHTENGRAKFSITTLHLHTRKGQNLNNRLYGRAEFFNADWADGWIYGQGTKAAGAATSFDLILHVRMRIFEIHCKAKKKRIFDHRLVSWLWGA